MDRKGPDVTIEKENMNIHFQYSYPGVIKKAKEFYARYEA